MKKKIINVLLSFQIIVKLKRLKLKEKKKIFIAEKILYLPLIILK